MLQISHVGHWTVVVANTTYCPKTLKTLFTALKFTYTFSKYSRLFQTCEGSDPGTILDPDLVGILKENFLKVHIWILNIDYLILIPDIRPYIQST
jgi:hypothetical protein